MLNGEIKRILGSGILTTGKGAKSELTAPKQKNRMVKLYRLKKERSLPIIQDTCNCANL